MDIYTSDEILLASLAIDNTRNMYVSNAKEIVYTDGLEPMNADLIIQKLSQNRSEKGMNELRKLRNEKLTESDIYMITDFPISAEKRLEIISYRNLLRNLPETLSNQLIDIDNLHQYLPASVKV